MLAVIFADEKLLSSLEAVEARNALRYWGVPFAARGTSACTEILDRVPAEAIWVVCDNVKAALPAREAGSPVVFIGPDPRFEPAPGDIVIQALRDLIEALSPHYTRTVLALRDVIASEFDSP